THGNELLLRDAVTYVNVSLALCVDCGFPGEIIPAVGLVVVANKNARFGWQVEQATYRCIQDARAATRKVGSGCAVIGHEQGIANEQCIANKIRDASRGMARGMQYGCRQLAYVECIAVAKQDIKFATVFRHVAQVEDGLEN